MERPRLDPVTRGSTPLPASDVDLLIVGAGFTGLWTAWFHSQLEPGRSILVIDSEEVGHGASGRNGGWCSSYLPMSLDRIATLSDVSTATRLQRIMHSTVDQIGDFATRHGIDCDWAKGGAITAARTPQQETRLRDMVEEARRFALGDEHVRPLDRNETERVVRMNGARRSVLQPACAAIHPGKLVHGLAEALRRRGVSIIEGVRLTELAPRVATVRAAGTSTRIRAGSIALCTEAWTSGFADRKRGSIPLYSMMIATEPIPRETWDEIGLDQRTVFADGRRLIIYGQRTADDRIAFGGRGASYHWGSRIESRFDFDDEVAGHLRRQLVELFPVLSDTVITHHWGGPLAAARDWTMSVEWDQRTGLGRAGNYVGDGVASSHLAGRILAEAMLGLDTEHTSLPVLGHRSPRWEPEPLRWLGINAMTKLAGSIDQREAKSTAETVRGSRLLDRLTGG